MPAPLAVAGDRPAFTPQAWAWGSLLAVPWLVAPQSTPSPSLVPWLVTLACLSLWFGNAARASAGRLPSDPALGPAWTASLLAGAGLNAVLGLLQASAVLPSLTGTDTQVFGFLRQRNQLATLLNLGLCVLLWAEPLRGRWRPLSNVLSLVLAATLAATASRTGLLGLVLVLGLRVYYLRKPGGVLLPALTYLLATLALYAMHAAGSGATGLLGRWSDTSEPCVGRQHIWSNVLELIAQRPWTGWGWGELAYAHVMADYRGLRTCEMVDNAHNLPLHLAVTLGLPLALLVLTTAAILVWRARPWAETDHGRQLAWAVLAAIGLHSLLEYPLWYGPFTLTTLLAVMQLLPSGAVKWLQQQLARRGAAYRACLGAAALTLTATLYAAWDYHRITQLYLAPEDRSAAYASDPLAAARASWLFRDAVAFAALQLTPLTAATAAQVHDDALRALHYSPEPMVLQKLAESAALLGHADEAARWRSRLRIAYPKEPVAPLGATSDAQGAT